MMFTERATTSSEKVNLWTVGEVTTHQLTNLSAFKDEAKNINRAIKNI